ncbi:MAG: hypothetical protein ACLUKN_15690 [Bacilli bacterium]
MTEKYVDANKLGGLVLLLKTTDLPPTKTGGKHLLDLKTWRLRPGGKTFKPFPKVDEVVWAVIQQ